MFPSEKYPTYGIFVQKIVKILRNNDFEVILSVIKKQPNSFFKMYSYLKFFVETIYKAIFFKYDLIYVHYADHSLYPFIVLQFFLKRKMLINFHGSDFMHPSKFNFLVEGVIQKADQLIVPSSNFRDMVQEKYPYSNYFISPSGGIDTSIFKPYNETKNLDKFIIGYVSRIDTGKGWDLLLKAFENLACKYAHIQLIMVGDGTQFSLLQDRVRNSKYADFITLIGQVDNQLLPNWYNKFDVFVFPTQLEESLGLVGLEALACGVPVVGSSVGGILSYLVDYENGRIFQKGDIQSLTECIEYFITLDENAFRKVALNATKTAFSFDEKIVGDRLIENLKMQLKG